jgi:hypothetical protein
LKRGKLKRNVFKTIEIHNSLLSTFNAWNIEDMPVFEMARCALGEWFQTCLRKIMPSFSKVKWTKKKLTLDSEGSTFVPTETTHPTTQRHFQTDRNFQSHTQNASKTPRLVTGTLFVTSSRP